MPEDTSRRKQERSNHNSSEGKRRRSLKMESEHKREEQLRFDQARLARALKMEDRRRLLLVESSLDITPKDAQLNPRMRRKDRVLPKSNEGAQLNLQMAEKDKVIRLADVTIFPKVGGGQGGETTYGYLEVHVNGFIYKDSNSNFRQHFYFEHIVKSFFRFGDKRMRPVLVFHLRRPYLVGTEETTGIVFHLVQGQKRSDHDSEEEKHIRDGARNQDLENFLEKMYDDWCFLPRSPCLFHELEKEYEFYGVLPSKEASVTFALTFFDLVVLVETSFTPFIVVSLHDIEFVNLAQLRPGEVDMTVIPQDFKEENVLEIHSIPLNLVAGIQDRLTCFHVKYFMNSKELDWKAIVKKVAAFPEEFVSKGGWDKFGLEEGCDTLAYYDLVKKAVDLDYAMLNIGWVQR